MFSENKYNARKLKVDGIVFDSRREAMRYSQLKMLERAGDICDLRMQVPFELIPAQREPDTVGARGGLKRGKVIEKAVTYYADFVYKDKDGVTVIVEDAKGFKTKEYKIKKKLMLFVHGIKIREV